MNFFLYIPFFLFTFFAKDEPKYPVSAIPEELKKDVNMVIRENKIEYRIISKSKAALHVLEAYTIFNSNGKDFAQEIIGYDKLSKVASFKGTAYDAQGNVLKKLKGSEIYDQSAYDGFSLYSDNRLKAADLSQATYPYTVEFEYEIEYKYLFHIPSLELIPEEKVAVQRTTYQLLFPKELTPRYTTLNIDAKPIVAKSAEGLEALTWSFENVKPIKLEPAGPSTSEVIPQIKASPSQFEYEGYFGTLNSWNEFGQWIGSLNKNRNVLPEATKQKVRDITSHFKTQEEKVRALYEYMQSKTRYVSIQLGIGGFQPFEAAVVDQTGYGDCKALSNYMVSLLEACGIKSNYILIRAGDDALPMNVQFPSSQFNHAVVAVPNGKDTIWLECTSQTNPFGYMGSFTGNRKAVAITESGAAIVRTPTYGSKDNIQSTKATVVVEATGDAKAKVKTSYSGLQYENGGLSSVVSKQYDDQKKWIQSNTAIPTFDINSFSVANSKDKIPTATVDLDLSLRRYASVSGKRIFITPNLMNKSTYVPEKVENRKSEVIRRMAYTDFDTVRYQLPEGIYPEFLPEPVKLKSRFGEYEATFKVDEKGLIYTRRMKMEKGTYPAESYNELIDFYRGVSKADNTKLVFVSKT
ncbi:MAG: hypothetical protein DI538_03570 [Azospira oryzae]|nr:MAG: hypothetical protein DI538_03570 [Azospira oryzae]